MNKNIKYSQNFLTSEKVLNQIIKQLNLKETDTVYEIGTGKGHLTTKLAKISKQVTSIELDSHLFNLSSEKLKLNTRVTLIHQDILQFQFPNKQRYKIVGNIPYNLSTHTFLKRRLHGMLDAAAAGNFHAHNGDASDIVIGQDRGQLLGIVDAVQLRAADQGNVIPDEFIVKIAVGVGGAVRSHQELRSVEIRCVHRRQFDLDRPLGELACD